MTETKRDLEELRQELSRVDGQLLTSLEKRAKLSRRIGDLRKAQPAQLPLTDRAQIAALVARASGEMPPEDLRVIFGRIYASSLALELPVRVAYPGPAGSAAYEAARVHFGNAAELVAVDGVAAALAEVSAGRAEFAIAPLETQAEGPVQHTIEAILATELKIVAEIELATDLSLLSKTGNEADVEKAYATAADHARAARFFASYARRISVLDVKSQAVACELATEDHGAAALVGETFGVERGLLVARRSVADAGPDRVRYAVVGARPSGRTGDDATSVVFSVNDAPGALLGVLKVFADRGINLKKIQSRPAATEEWAYLFFLELSGHATDRPLITAFDEVRQKTRFFKVLGSYPAP